MNKIEIAQFVDRNISIVDLTTTYYRSELDEDNNIIRRSVNDQKSTELGIFCKVCHCCLHPNALHTHIKEHLKK